MSFRPLPAVLLIATFAAVRPANAAPIYFALGDSITFGETDLTYVPSYGNRGYVDLYANYLGARDGVKPSIQNFAIDGETTASFATGSGRVPPVSSRTDPILAAENLNYNPNALVSQLTRLQNAVTYKPPGDTINYVTISLGFNDLASVVNTGQPISAVLATFRTNYTNLLTQVKQLAPTASLSLLNYFNPFPADPGSPAAPIFATGGPQLNAIIQDLATQFGAHYVDTAKPFRGNEAVFTYIDEMPHGSLVTTGPFPGLIPIGNVHPNAVGYASIASQVIAANPEPASLASLAMGGVLVLRRRRVANAG